MMFCCDTGFLKKMTDATMTMTLFRQLPMECVTGDTLCRIMYDTWEYKSFHEGSIQCWYLLDGHGHR
jgi:hypothetical protein